MAGHLIRLKLAMLRHQPGGWWTWKSWVGLLLALWSLAVLVSAPAEPGAMTSGLGFMLLVWILGAVVLSLQSGGGESLLLPAHFALLPIPPWRLATGLFAAAFASPFALILALALLAMPLGGVRLGVAAGAVSIVSFVLQVLFAVLLVRVVVDAASAAMRTRVGVTMVALQYALLISLSSVGWVLIGGFTTAGIGDWFQGNMPDALATLVRVLPTGWGAVAIGAAADGRWLLVVASLAALLALNGGLFFA